jgi:hypothetical protein
VDSFWPKYLGSFSKKFITEYDACGTELAFQAAIEIVDESFIGFVP